MTSATTENLGFAAQNFNWDDYIRYRPLYPQSLYNRVFAYHAQHSGSWDVAHDVGAGAGIVAEGLASRFRRVIVSDPNGDYIEIARNRLSRIDHIGTSETKFSFLQEKAESSSVESGTVDVVCCFEAIHWTEMAASVDEFARQLKIGGTVVVFVYDRPRLVGNHAAKNIWDGIFEAWERRIVKVGDVMARALRNSNSWGDAVPFPAEQWEEGVERLLINTGGPEPMDTEARRVMADPSRVVDTDRKESIDVDEDWISEKDLEWLKGSFATFLPGLYEEGSLLEAELGSCWEQLNMAIGNGNKIKVVWPAFMILASKR